jgi:hypothetical protein
MGTALHSRAEGFAMSHGVESGSAIPSCQSCPSGDHIVGHGGRRSLLDVLPNRVRLWLRI